MVVIISRAQKNCWLRSKNKWNATSRSRGEFFLTDTISLMIEDGAKVRTQNGESWLDTGTIEATLETNNILLEQGKANKTKDETNDGVEIIAPSFVHPEC